MSNFPPLPILRMNPSSRRPLAAALLAAVAMSASVATQSARAQTAPTEVEAAAPAAPVEAPATETVAPLSAEQLAQQEEARLLRAVATAADLRQNAERQIAAGLFDQAIESYNLAIGFVSPANPYTQPILAELEQAKADVALARVDAALAKTSLDEAKALLEGYRTTVGVNERYETRAKALEKLRAQRPLMPIEQASPNFLAEQESIAALLLRGRSQYVAGDIDGAENTLKRAELLDPENLEAKGLLVRIAADRRRTTLLNREKTREQMLVDVTRAWQMPGVITEGSGLQEIAAEENPLNQKIAKITIPSVNFNAIELSRVVATLSQISEEFDTTGIGTKGVNIVLLDNERRNPSVSIQLRNLTLRRVLDFICQSVNYQYDVQADAIVITPLGSSGSSTVNLDTAFFPVSRSAVTRMIGASGNVNRAAAAPADPFAEGFGTPAPAPIATATPTGEAAGIQNFLQSAGVDFLNEPGSALAYDGSQLIVTQTSKNIERIRNILNRYTDVKQVEIATRFMEVSEGALDELGFNWGMSQSAGAPVPLPGGGFGAPNVRNVQTFAPNDRGAVLDPGTGSNLRNLGQSVSGSASSNTGGISNIVAGQNVGFSVSAPTLPGIPDLGGSATSIANLVQRIGDFDVSAVIRALARKQGSDLLSEPKVTVLSGNTATITVAQELRYPGNYNEAESEVSDGGGTTGGGGNSATITAATPQDFETRNVGVELTVTPTVEEDDYSISLDLNPRVTEFEGFVEYGGQNIAISGTTIVRTPSGIYQPVFAVRSVTTKATIWDGATIILGGLTREEVRRVNDKVPVLGNIPLLGRLFRSEGESSQKRNLLIFVTANLVSPGGSPKRQTLRGVQPGSLFQNPTYVTPAGSSPRRPDDNR